MAEAVRGSSSSSSSSISSSTAAPSPAGMKWFKMKKKI
jgi:hypothetical protein